MSPPVENRAELQGMPWFYGRHRARPASATRTKVRGSAGCAGRRPSHSSPAPWASVRAQIGAWRRPRYQLPRVGMHLIGLPKPKGSLRGAPRGTPFPIISAQRARSTLASGMIWDHGPHPSHPLLAAGRSATQERTRRSDRTGLGCRGPWVAAWHLPTRVGPARVGLLETIPGGGHAWPEGLRSSES